MAQFLKRYVEFGDVAAAEACSLDAAAVIEDVARRHFGNGVNLHIDGGRVDGVFRTSAYEGVIEAESTNEYLKGGFRQVYRLSATGGGQQVAKGAEHGRMVEAAFAGVGMVIGIAIGLALVGFLAMAAEVIDIQFTIMIVIGGGAVGSGLGAAVGHMFADRVQARAKKKSVQNDQLAADVERWSVFLAELETAIDGILPSR